MQRRIAVKRLTASDLTLFEWQFRNRNAGNQKSINLNADVFIGQLFPALPEIAAESNGRIPVDLYIYGPGHTGVHNLQRKILKGNAYKNWRLNGEYITNPENEPERYNVLEPGDLALFDFQGPVSPTTTRLILISQLLPEDQVIHHQVSSILGTRSMSVLPMDSVRAIADQQDDRHSLHELILDAELEDAALGGLRGRETLRRRSVRPISAAELRRARRLAEDVGREGEELVCRHLLAREQRDEIESVQWVSDSNAVAPYDFIIVQNGLEIAIDVKATRGEFDRPIHISSAELIEMNQGRRYDIYRISELSEGTGQLRIAENVGGCAPGILHVLQDLPKGVRADSISVEVSTLSFGDSFRLEWSALADAEPE